MRANVKVVFCIDCIHYAYKKDEEANIEHECWRLTNTKKSLVTGKDIYDGPILDCEEERQSSCAVDLCGEIARFFTRKSERKKVPLVHTYQIKEHACRFHFSIQCHM